MSVAHGGFPHKLARHNRLVHVRRPSRHEITTPLSVLEGPMMRTRMTVLLAAVAAVALLPTTPAAAVLRTKWAAVPPVPRPAGSTGSWLQDVAARSVTDVWAVGGWSDGAKHPLAAHWDGTGWSVAALPDGSTTVGQSSLAAVDSTAVNDVWAVGSGQTTGPQPVTTPLVLHYDGAAWAVVPVPSTGLGTMDSALNDVDMLSAVDGWAVGYAATSSSPAQPLILRWQGGRWTPVAVSSPPNAPSATLTAVSARSTSDVWAVGSQARSDGTRTSLVLHWDGTTWQAVTVPVAAAGASEQLSGVAAMPSGEVWAVGRSCATLKIFPVCRPLIMRLAGGVWGTVPGAAGGTELTAVLALSSTDVWAIGYTSPAPGAETDYAEHWDGQRFTADTAPDGNSEPASALIGAAATPDGGQLWAVGWLNDPKRGETHATNHG
jgi:hypothetical protein